jgi:hypothetical protein
LIHNILPAKYKLGGSLGQNGSMKELYVPSLSEEQKVELDEYYRKTDIPGVHTGAQMALLSAEKGLNTEEIAEIVRESSVTILRWLHRYIAEGIQGLMDTPRSGRSSIVVDHWR